MSNILTIQTAAAFERINEALVGNTEDNLSSLILHLTELIEKAKKIEEVSACMLSGDC